MRHNANQMLDLFHFRDRINTQQVDRAAVGGEQAGQHGDGGAFPGSVWSQQPEDFAFLDVKTKVAYRYQGAVLLGQAARLQDGLCHVRSPYKSSVHSLRKMIAANIAAAGGLNMWMNSPIVQHSIQIGGSRRGEARTFELPSGAAS